MQLIRLISLLTLLCWSTVADQNIVTFTETTGGDDDSLSLIKNGKPQVNILTSANDWPGVHRASEDLSEDFGRVSGSSLAIQNYTTNSNNNNLSATTIIVGTVGKSQIIDKIIDNGKLNATFLKDKWESYQIQVIKDPVDSVSNALVIAGSDKRGTIYGIYELSQNIGVSPWYYFADVASKHHETIIALPVDIKQKEPSVKYRGIFINDEAPSLTNHVNEFYKRGPYSSSFTSGFYVNVFELLLRLKANVLWPASWNSMFNWDDPENQKLADYYGIVMSTSHTEPMMRASNEWAHFGKGPYDYRENKEKLLEFWNDGVKKAGSYENVWEMGMRGIGDSAMKDGTPELMEKIVKDQQKLLKNNLNTSDIPQIWSLYKEVMQIYNQGMNVPDDITILWADDNFGNLRRLPIANETGRAGGAGIYYHFEYVGRPRSYKWSNTIQLQQSWEQLHMSYHRNARNFWVVNVGDIKPLEFPMNYFLDLAYDFDKWGEVNKVFDWEVEWASKTFGEDMGFEIAEIMDDYGKYAARKKFEAIDPDTYSVSNYGEADSVVREWHNLMNRTLAVYEKLPDDNKDSFFELILHQVIGGVIVYDIQIAAGKNNVYADQRRTVVNTLVDYARSRFKDDHELKKRYHGVKDGKWNHLMDQTHFGYSQWEQPMRDNLPPMIYTQIEDESLGGPMGATLQNTNGSIPGDNQWNAGDCCNNTLIFEEMNPYSPDQYRYIDVYSRGYEDFDFEVIPLQDYVKAEPSKGNIKAFADEVNSTHTGAVRVNLTVDWDKVPEGNSQVDINITTSKGYGNAAQIPTPMWEFIYPQAVMLLNNTKLPQSFKQGFIETEKHVTFEAEHATRNTTGNKNESYTVIERYGKTLSGVTLFPVLAETQNPPSSPRLEYDFYVFSENVTANANVVVSPTLNHYPSRPLKYAISIDDEDIQTVQLSHDPEDAEDMPDGWEEAVTDNAWKHKTNHTSTREPGKHTLKLWAVEPGVVFQKVILDLGGVKDSYLGPPESPKI